MIKFYACGHCITVSPRKLATQIKVSFVCDHCKRFDNDKETTTSKEEQESSGETFVEDPKYSARGEKVDAADLKSAADKHAGSSPVARTTNLFLKRR